MKVPAWVPTMIAFFVLSWGIATAWFALEKRVSVLELQQKFSHGDLRPYLPREGP